MIRAALLVMMAIAAAPVAAAGRCAGPIESADYGSPTGRYPHGILGDNIEWGNLSIRCGGTVITATLPEALVFEDVAPRLADLDGDGAPEVITVESHRDAGARLAVWGIGPKGFGRVAMTPHIGTRFRWLAPIGAADLDGDGFSEIAYIDRPHLARVLRVWRYEPGRLTEVAAAQGYSNHRIGERDIAGGIRDCGGVREMIVANAEWTRVKAVRLENGRLVERDAGPHAGRSSFATVMACR